MPPPDAILTSWSRGGLAVLCILLTISVTLRIYVFLNQSAAGSAVASEAYGGSVDLGEGNSASARQCHPSHRDGRYLPSTGFYRLCRGGPTMA